MRGPLGNEEDPMEEMENEDMSGNGSFLLHWVVHAGDGAADGAPAAGGGWQRPVANQEGGRGKPHTLRLFFSLKFCAVGKIQCRRAPKKKKKKKREWWVSIRSPGGSSIKMDLCAHFIL